MIGRAGRTRTRSAGLPARSGSPCSSPNYVKPLKFHLQSPQCSQNFGDVPDAFELLQ